MFVKGKSVENLNIVLCCLSFFFKEKKKERFFFLFFLNLSCVCVFILENCWGKKSKWVLIADHITPGPGYVMNGLGVTIFSKTTERLVTTILSQSRSLRFTADRMVFQRSPGGGGVGGGGARAEMQHPVIPCTFEPVPPLSIVSQPCPFQASHRPLPSVHAFKQLIQESRVKIFIPWAENLLPHTVEAKIKRHYNRRTSSV